MVSKFAQPFVALCFLYLFGQPAAQAVDAISFELLSGNKSQVQNIGSQWTWQNKWFETTGAHLGGYWNATFARWRNSRHHGIPGNIQSLNDIGLAASFRYQRNDHTGFFIEAATGPPPSIGIL